MASGFLLLLVQWRLANWLYSSAIGNYLNHSSFGGDIGRIMTQFEELHNVNKCALVGL